MKVTIPEPTVTIEMNMHDAMVLAEWSWEAFEATECPHLGAFSAELNAALEDFGYAPVEDEEESEDDPWAEPPPLHLAPHPAVEAFVEAEEVPDA